MTTAPAVGHDGGCADVAELDLLDPGFRVDSPEVRSAAERNWYARTPLGPAIPCATSPVPRPSKF